MSDTKIFSFPDSGSGGANSIAAMLPSLLQSRGIDPAYLLGMMNNGNGNGFFGGNGGFQDIIALIVIAAIFGNGNGNGIFGGGGNREGSEMIMQTLNRNGIDIAALAQSVNTSSDRIMSGINSVSQAICGLGNQMGQSTNSILTALLQGNNALTSQICSCCCDMKSLVTTQGYEGQLRTVQQTQDIIQNATGNTSVLAAKIDAQTQIINDRFCQLEMREMQNKLDAERAKSAALSGQLSQEHQTAQVGQMIGTALAPANAALADLSARLAKIECKQPETITVPNPQGVVIPNCVAAQLGLGYGLNGAGAYGFWG